MAIYKITVTDEQVNGTSVAWAGSKKEAEDIAREMGSDNLEDDITVLETPRGKKAIVRFLTTHTPEFDNG